MEPGVVATYLDSGPSFQQVTDNPTSYGAPNATCSDMDGATCLWTDKIHPGKAIHTVLASDILDLLVTLGFYDSSPPQSNTTRA